MDTRTALLIVDMISEFDFADGDKLFERTKFITGPLRELKTHCRKNGVPVIYINDNLEGKYGDVETLLRNVETSEKGRRILHDIAPVDGDTLLLKPQRSAFYKTDLDRYLDRANIGNVIITGLTTDICVLFTAHDADMRKLKVTIPSDCVTAVNQAYHDDALRFIERVIKADTTPSLKL
jgi:nicotinamidase-related amidase